MKKLVFALILGILFVSCGSTSVNNEASTEDSTIVVVDTIAIDSIM